jgi:hypothetical protein
MKAYDALEFFAVPDPTVQFLQSVQTASNPLVWFSIEDRGPEPQ